MNFGENPTPVAPPAEVAPSAATPEVAAAAGAEAAAERQEEIALQINSLDQDLNDPRLSEWLSPKELERIKKDFAEEIDKSIDQEIASGTIGGTVVKKVDQIANLVNARRRALGTGTPKGSTPEVAAAAGAEAAAERQEEIALQINSLDQDLNDPRLSEWLSPKELERIKKDFAEEIDKSIDQEIASGTIGGTVVKKVDQIANLVNARRRALGTGTPKGSTPEVAAAAGAEAAAERQEEIALQINSLDQDLNDPRLSEWLSPKELERIKKDFAEEIDKSIDQEIASGTIGGTVVKKVDQIANLVNARRRALGTGTPKGSTPEVAAAAGAEAAEKQEAAEPQTEKPVQGTVQGSGANEIPEATIKNIQTREDMMQFLGTVEGIQGSDNFFKSEDLKKIITEVLDSGDKAQLAKVTRANDLRNKVHEIMIREKIKKM